MAYGKGAVATSVQVAGRNRIAYSRMVWSGPNLSRSIRAVLDPSVDGHTGSPTIRTFCHRCRCIVYRHYLGSLEGLLLVGFAVNSYLMYIVATVNSVTRIWFSAG